MPNMRHSKHSENILLLNHHRSLIQTDLCVLCFFCFHSLSFITGRRHVAHGGGVGTVGGSHSEDVHAALEMIEAHVFLQHAVCRGDGLKG